MEFPNFRKLLRVLIGGLLCTQADAQFVSVNWTKCYEPYRTGWGNQEVSGHSRFHRHHDLDTRSSKLLTVTADDLLTSYSGPNGGTQQYVLIEYWNGNYGPPDPYGYGTRWKREGVFGSRVKYRKDGTVVSPRGWPLITRYGSDMANAGHLFFPDEFLSNEVYVEVLGRSDEVLARYDVNLPVAKCKSCKTGCSTNPQIGSVDYSIPIGLGVPILGDLGDAVSLEFYQDQIASLGRKSFKFIRSEAGSSILPVYDSNDEIQSVRVGEKFAKIEPLGGVSQPGSLKITISSDYQNAAATVIRTVTIQNKTDANQATYLEFNDQEGSSSTITAYRKNAAGAWIMETGNGMRRETHLTTETATLRTVRKKVEERIATAVGATPAVYASVSDVTTQSTNSSFGWQEVLKIEDPDGLALTTTTAYGPSDATAPFTGSPAQIAAGQITSVTHPTGEIETHSYFNYPAADFFDSAHVVKRAFAGNQQARETTTDSFSGLSPVTGLSITAARVTERVAGQIVSKQETAYESRIDGTLIEERVYSSDTDFSVKYTYKNYNGTITVINPDGSASITSKLDTLGASATETVTTIDGYVTTDPALGVPVVQPVTRTESITDAYGEEIANNVYRYQGANQVLISRKLTTAFDGNHRGTRFEHFVEGATTPTFVTEKEYGCCGIARERDESGVDTYYAYDALRRLVLTNRNGVTTETVRRGTAVSTHRYPQTVLAGGYLVPLGIASAANEISRTVTNVIGDRTAEWSRSAQDGSLVAKTMATTYNLGNGIGKRVITRPPVTTDDGAEIPEQIDDTYLDGTPAKSSGILGPDLFYRYLANATGIVTQTGFLDGATEKETTSSQQDRAGRQVKTTYASDADGVGGNDFSSSVYNSKGQLTKSTDPDGVTQLYTYNLQGELTDTATDLNGNGVIDLAVDQVSSSQTDLATRPNGEWVLRTTQMVWLDAASTTGTPISYSDVSLDGLRQWTLQNPSVQTRESTSVTTVGAGGNRLEVSTLVDGTSQTTTTTNGLVSNVTSRDSNGSLVYQTSMTYDALQRPLTQTDSRTGLSSVSYVNTATDIVNRSVDNLSRETLLTYDHRGRAKTTNLPDTLNESGGVIPNLSTITYFPDGSVKEKSGDGGYRTTQTYDYAQRVSTLTTYGTQTAITRWIYDANRGRLVSKRYNSPTPSSGTGSSYTYTAAGKLKTRTQARSVSGNPLVSTHLYGTASGSSPASLDQVTHSDGTPAFTITTRDRLGRPLGLVDPAAGNRTMRYSRFGSLEEDAITSGILAGQKLQQGFDTLLRPRSHTATFGTQALGATFYQYGPSGSVSHVSGNGNTASYFYHPQKRTLETIAYTQDSEALPMLQSTRQHDAANRLTRITTHVNDAGVQKPIDHHGYDYDALDHIQKQTSITGASWKYGYNSTGEVTTAAQKMPNTTTDYFGRNYRYRYDGIGNRTSVEQSRTGAQASRLFSYSPNALNQYTTHTHPDFLDVTGMANPLTAVTVNGLAATRQLDYFYKEISKSNTSSPQWLQATISDGTTTSSGALSLPAMQTSPSYDADGNLTADSEWIYTWDAENRLIRIERTAASIAVGAPYHRELHDYDYRSRRIRTRIYANTGITPSSHVLYVFDSWKCVAELSSTGLPLRKYTWGLDLAGSTGDTTTGNIGALLWLVDTPTAKTHIHLYDKNGNVTGLLDTTTRKRSATYAYDAFGQLITCFGEYSKLNPFTYSTKFTDHTTSLRYYGYRWYGAKDGRWLSRDPIEEKGGVNLYGFVGNNGVDHYDYLGLSKQSVLITWKSPGDDGVPGYGGHGGVSPTPPATRNGVLEAEASASCNPYPKDVRISNWVLKYDSIFGNSITIGTPDFSPIQIRVTETYYAESYQGDVSTSSENGCCIETRKYSVNIHNHTEVNYGIKLPFGYRWVVGPDDDKVEATFKITLKIKCCDNNISIISHEN